MAKVEVHMYATLRETSGASHVSLDASDVSSMFDVLSSRFGPAFQQIVAAARRDDDQVVILVNGRHLDRRTGWRTKLKDGDEIALFPPVSGG